MRYWIALGIVGLALGPLPVFAQSVGDGLVRTDTDFAEATAKRGLEGFLSYFAADATVMAGRPLTSKEDLRAYYGAGFSQPGFQLKWKPIKGEGSGEYGYTLGRYESSFVGPGGKPVTSSGSYLTVWKKQTDGSWKVISDLGSPDPPK
ncbi:YybH family protein [Gloeobacter kilaueensis]|uniref:DUF4440 domain-containing protein n=1 Tax=Gloeobacter kilaueensis (strain ATCC BAA-2537 / CCAP 1431/1 / ULC 316 / JS1) TaxID=1183438 RepID=U5QI21_GLOK1|nr:nuclear transport factor 2 family protein [Gloeobacter kilaueensis]AGY58523.1 hypothetical protein GKIL_2277 [Gloeobacter kilaueensis JS1]